jgi:tetratricopeptide (TPR) repeat protein
MFENDP